MKSTQEVGIPTTSQILRYLIRVLDLPIKGATGFGYKDLQRLETGGLSEARTIKVIEAILDHLWSLGSTCENDGALAAVKAKFEGNDHAAMSWRYDDQGQVIFGRDEFLREFLEFLGRNDALRRAVGPRFRGPTAVFIWLRQFVIPFWAAILAECTHVGVRWDRGMPGGQFWFLPQIHVSSSGATVHRWPSNIVMAWWQDMLGHSLEKYASGLCGANLAPSYAVREIQRCPQRRALESFHVDRRSQGRQAYLEPIESGVRTAFRFVSGDSGDLSSRGLHCHDQKRPHALLGDHSVWCKTLSGGELLLRSCARNTRFPHCPSKLPPSTQRSHRRGSKCYCL